MTSVRHMFGLKDSLKNSKKHKHMTHYSVKLDCNGYHYTKIRGVYRQFINTDKPCLNNHCRCGGRLYHSHTRHDLVVCEDCGLTYIVLLIDLGNSQHKIYQE